MERPLAMATERQCGLGSLLSMTCRDRAEAFARRLQSRLQSLGGGGRGQEEADEEEEPPPAEPPPPPPAPAPRPPLRCSSSSDSDLFYDFDADSPGSPADDTLEILVVEQPRGAGAGDDPESGCVSGRTAASPDSDGSDYFDPPGSPAPPTPPAAPAPSPRCNGHAPGLEPRTLDMATLLRDMEAGTRRLSLEMVLETNAENGAAARGPLENAYTYCVPSLKELCLGSSKHIRTSFLNDREVNGENERGGGDEESGWEGKGQEEIVVTALAVAAAEIERRDDEQQGNGELNGEKQAEDDSEEVEENDDEEEAKDEVNGVEEGASEIGEGPLSYSLRFETVVDLHDDVEDDFSEWRQRNASEKAEESLEPPSTTVCTNEDAVEIEEEKERPIEKEEERKNLEDEEEEEERKNLEEQEEEDERKNLEEEEEEDEDDDSLTLVEKSIEQDGGEEGACGGTSRLPQTVLDIWDDWFDRVSDYGGEAETTKPEDGSAKPTEVPVCVEASVTVTCSSLSADGLRPVSLEDLGIVQRKPRPDDPRPRLIINFEDNLEESGEELKEKGEDGEEEEAEEAEEDEEESEEEEEAQEEKKTVVRRCRVLVREPSDEGDERRPGRNRDGTESPRQRLRRCSSLKTGKTPPGTPGRKKIVRFADVLGLDLADVRTFLDEIPRVPSSAYDDLRDMDVSTAAAAAARADAVLGPSVLPCAAARPPRCLVPMFQQPVGQPDFLERVRKRFVCLENAVVQDPVVFSVGGVARVRNLDFQKSVFVRYSVDGWKSYADLQASYVPHSCDGFSDKFTFVLYAHTLTVGQRIEFALRFQCKGTQYWDNNSGANYVFQCLPASGPAPPSVDAPSYPPPLPSPEDGLSSFY